MELKSCGEEESQQAVLASNTYAGTVTQLRGCPDQLGLGMGEPGNFRGSPVLKTLFPLQGARVRS